MSTWEGMIILGYEDVKKIAMYLDMVGLIVPNVKYSIEAAELKDTLLRALVELDNEMENEDNE